MEPLYCDECGTTLESHWIYGEGIYCEACFNEKTSGRIIMTIDVATARGSAEDVRHQLEEVNAAMTRVYDEIKRREAHLNRLEEQRREMNAKLTALGEPLPPSPDFMLTNNYRPAT